MVKVLRSAFQKNSSSQQPRCSCRKPDPLHARPGSAARPGAARPRPCRAAGRGRRRRRRGRTGRRRRTASPASRPVRASRLAAGLPAAAGPVGFAERCAVAAAVRVGSAAGCAGAGGRVARPVSADAAVSELASRTAGQPSRVLDVSCRGVPALVGRLALLLDLAQRVGRRGRRRSGPSGRGPAGDALGGLGEDLADRARRRSTGRLASVDLGRS